MLFTDQRVFFRKQVINQTLAASIRHLDSYDKGATILLVDESEGGVGILHNSNRFEAGDEVILRIGTFEYRCEIKSSIKTDLRVIRAGLEFKHNTASPNSQSFSSLMN